MSIVMRAIRLLSLFFIAFALCSCSAIKHKDKDADTMPVQRLYQYAHKSLGKGHYHQAADKYQRLMARFPYGEYNQQANIELAYAQWKDKKPEDAYTTINTFIRTFPTNKHIAYAYYLRGLINFNRTGSFLQHFFHRHNGSRLDQSFRTQAFEDFNQLVRRFPKSEYAKDARQRMIYLRNQRAEYNIHAAEFYLWRKAYVAAAKRAKYVIENFQQAPQVADALAISARSYKALGLDKPAEQSRKILALNYPEHPYLKDASWPHRDSTVRRMIPFSGHH